MRYCIGFVAVVMARGAPFVLPVYRMWGDKRMGDKMNKLTTCKTCGQPVAKSAKTCPHCGAKVVNTGRALLQTALIMPLVIIAAIIFALILAGPSDDTENPGGEAGNPPAASAGQSGGQDEDEDEGDGQEGTPPAFEPITRTLGNWDITLTNFEFKKTISSGLLTAFSAEEGNQYAVASLSVTNNGQEAANFLPLVIMPGDISAKLEFGEYEYTLSTLVGHGDDLIYTAVNPLVTVSGIIAFVVPDAVVASEDALQLRFSQGGASESFDLR